MKKMTTQEQIDKLKEEIRINEAFLEGFKIVKSNNKEEEDAFLKEMTESLKRNCR